MIRLLSSIMFVSGIALFGAVFVYEEKSMDDEHGRKQLWEQVKQAEQQSLPKSAIQSLEKIYTSAIEDRDFPDAVRALSKKYFVEGSINQPIAPYVIRKLSTDVDSFPPEIQPVMKVILANWFFSYYQQNRWRFAQRSQTGLPPSEDFEAWDLARLLGEIDLLFTDALASADELKKIPITDYDQLIEKGNVSDNHRPTLFDFIAFQALEFYSLDEQIIRKQGAFDLRADSPIFSATKQFQEWQPKTGDDTSFLLNAIQLYQDIIAFHENDDDVTARLDADLHRLRFGYQVAVGTEGTARYKAALRRFADDHADHPLSAIALASLAGVLHGEDELVKARELASQGLARHPGSQGGNQCFNLIKQIEASELQVSTERVWNSAGPVLNVQYRNIERIHFRLVKFDYQNWRWGDLYKPESIDEATRKRMLKQRPAKSWSHDLPKTADFRKRSEAVPVELKLESGCYLLFASIKDDFSEQKNVISISEVWVGNLAVVLRHEYGQTLVAGHVVDAISGDPIAGATIETSAWVRDGRNSRSINLPQGTTDALGFFAIPGRQRAQHRVMIRHAKGKLGFIDQNYKYARNQSQHLSQQTIFFTDRSIYRPGQTVNFKGICVSSDTNRNDYKVLPRQQVVVALKDVNSEEVERRSFRTNEFGSFSGSFTAPRDRATGQMRVEVVNGSPRGNGFFRVEEYKRPKFFVEVDKPDQAFRLNDTISVTGKAKSYTGAAIDGAKVSWRVVREVRYPDWWMWRCWWCPPATGDAQEIANGIGETDVNGAFTVEFKALPDLSVDRESEPVFTYSVYADVTDTAGETRSSKQPIRIGYTSLQAVLKCDDWQTTERAVSISLTTSTLDGEGQANEGVLKVYKLTAPGKVQRARLKQSVYMYGVAAGEDTQEPDLSKINAWPIGASVSTERIVTAGDGVADVELELEAGAYKAVFETTDKSGQKVTAEIPILVVDLDSRTFETKIPHHFQARDWTVEVGQEFTAVWGSGYNKGRAFIELVHRGKVFRSFWTESNRTQTLIKHNVSEQFRGGFNVRATFVRENRAYVESHRVHVPWSNKKLQVKWEHFVSKLQPGGRETWTVAITGPDADKAAAEMVATLYDASLDAFAPHNWPESINVFYKDYSQLNLAFQNDFRTLHPVVYNIRAATRNGYIQYRYFQNDIAPMIGRGWRSQTVTRDFSRGGRLRKSSATPLGGVFNGEVVMESAMATSGEARLGSPQSFNQPAGFAMLESEDADDSGNDVDLSNVTARKNLQETAFFFPNLTVDDQGTVRIEFEVPEALTQWSFLGFSHDKDLRTALLKDEAVTSKDLMVQPNPPRFLREGDVLEFSVKVSNQSPTRQAGKVRLSFTDARDDSSMDARLGNQELDQTFDIPAGQSESLFWRLNVPDFVGVLTYKAVGATERLSDGEEGFLPVLSKRILVTESLPLPIRGNQTRDFLFDRLKKADESDSLESQSLTVQMTSNPAWYAVMALPYLMEYPHQCSEQVFNRLYANSLAQHVANSNPKIKRVFDQWRGTDALDSPLEKNDDIRNVLIAESPWLRDAKKESQARRDVAVLFEQNRLNAEIKRALNQLKQMQYSDGSWPWFPGGRANDYITLYVTTGFGRMRHLGVPIDVGPAIQSLDRLDNWIHNTYQKILKDHDPADNHLSPNICLYLYGRSFFLNDKAVDAKYKTAVDYFLGQGKKYWPKLGNRQSQAHLAIAMKRFGDLGTPREIMKSLTERSISDDELGMFWRESQGSWWWYRAPIETQALIIEAYDEVADDQNAVEECKIWLLKQKQTQNWKTTKATADAVYALLLRGSDLLASGKLVRVKLGDLQIEPGNVEAGTGYYQQRFVRDEIKSEMASINVSKQDQGVAWGSVHWQYLEDVAKIEPYEGTPLTLKKSLYIKMNTERGPVIEPVNGAVQVGDELVTRVELRVDRDMEYVHLKDYRGSGTEPVNVLSRYKFQDGLSYYESTKDTASHFFIDYLPRGTYVFEYSVRVQHRGNYQTGIAELQCMYAPEFNSHSGSVGIEVK